MAIKKSELYRSLWAGCDELRGSMDAGQYKDYVLVLLFMKYVSDKGDKLVHIPKGGSFKDMVKLKGDPEIGDKINKSIGALARENDLNGIITVADFDDDEKLGKGKEKVDRLSNLISIFEKPELDFSSNRAEGDDLLGDAYEYLMRNFATESGKSKGQFYTPAEVSRIMAKVISITTSKSQSDTLYDPTCGSGSLLLKAADEAPRDLSIYGQENDNATRALAVMNMWLHGYPTSDIVQGNTLAHPHFKHEITDELKQFDFAVANPPFSYKAWTNGWNPADDIYKRFEGYDAQPPNKNGDFAFLLHLVKSLKSTGKGCIVMPLGVLFRGNAEAVIRKKLVQKGYIKGIIGLPPNLFYGTGIAACLIVIDKENAESRREVFMIDAGKGFMKDGNKNRLREQDIHKIVDTFNNCVEIPGYSRRIPVNEIADSKNDYNLNIPRYIDSQDTEDVQDIAAHLSGGIPTRDIDALEQYWAVYPTLKQALFEPHGDATHRTDARPRVSIIADPTAGYVADFDTSYAAKPTLTPQSTSTSASASASTSTSASASASTGLSPCAGGLRPFGAGGRLDVSRLRVGKDEIKAAIFNHPEFMAFSREMEMVLGEWKTDTAAVLKALEAGLRPKDEIRAMAESLLAAYRNRPLLDAYDVYQHVMDYWADTMQDDFYELAADGWKVGNEVKRLEKKIKKGRKEFAKAIPGLDGLEGTLIPPALIIQEYCAEQQRAIDELQARVESLNAEMEALREEHGGEDGLLTNAMDDKGKISKSTLRNAIKNAADDDVVRLLRTYKQLMDDESTAKNAIKQANAELEILVIKQYPALNLDDIKTLVVDKKWMPAIEQRIRTELDNISHRLTQRIKELADRYETPLPQLTDEVNELTAKVEEHLKRMNFAW